MIQTHQRLDELLWTFLADIHGPKRINPNDFAGPLTSMRLTFVWTIMTIIGWIAMKFCYDIQGAERINSTHVNDPLTLRLVGLSAKVSVFWIKYFQNDWKFQTWLLFHHSWTLCLMLWCVWFTCLSYLTQPWRFTYLSLLLTFSSRLDRLSWRKEGKLKWR